MKTSEMIAMLEKNPKLRFESEFEPFKPLTASVGTEALVLRDKEGFRAKVEGLNLKRDWQLIQEPVPWQEAIQAWAEGKMVRCVWRNNGGVTYKGSPLWDVNENPLVSGEILDGTWYIIEDGEANG